MDSSNCTLNLTSCSEFSIVGSSWQAELNFFIKHANISSYKEITDCNLELCNKTNKTYSITFYLPLLSNPNIVISYSLSNCLNNKDTKETLFLLSKLVSLGFNINWDRVELLNNYPAQQKFHFTKLL